MALSIIVPPKPKLRSSLVEPPSSAPARHPIFPEERNGMRPSADQLFDTIKPFLRPLVPSPRLKQPRAYRVIKRTKRPARLVVEKKKPLTYVRQLLRESRERIKDEAILLKWIEKGDRAWHDWDFQLLPATPATPQSEQAEAKAEEASTVAEAQPWEETSDDWSFVQEKNGGRADRRPGGLQNPHYFCYRRSAFQALLHIPALLTWLGSTAKQHRESRLHGPKNHWQKASCLPCALANLAARLWTAADTTPALRTLDNSLRHHADTSLSSTWATGTSQEDAMDPISFLLNHLSTTWNQGSRISALFHTRSLTRWECVTCSTIHTRTEPPEPYLPIDLAADSLSACLDASFVQSLDDLACDHCNTKATRERVRFLRDPAPAALLLQLKRFDAKWNPHTGRLDYVKVKKRVALDLFLDLGRYCDGPVGAARRGYVRPQLRYKLASVVAHAGTMASGHYVTYARGPAGVARLDDSRVSGASVAEMVSPPGGFTPYIVTYVRC